MTEGITRAQCDARNTIAIVLTVEDWAGGADDPLHLVRNDDGQWGHAVQCNLDAHRDEDRPDFDEDEPIDHDMCTWYVDEATARRALRDDAPDECECDNCGLTAFARDARDVGDGCRLCRECAPPIKRGPRKPKEPAAVNAALPLFGVTS